MTKVQVERRGDLEAGWNKRAGAEVDNAARHESYDGEKGDREEKESRISDSKSGQPR